MFNKNLIKCAVVIPCYKVSDEILKVVKSIGPEVDKIYVIDDACPENSGKLVKENIIDERVVVLRNLKNSGVGSSTKKGFVEAFKDKNIDVCIKIDGDGQMDSKNIKKFLEPFTKSQNLYVKGNRFHAHKKFLKMPVIRIFGNFFLSLISKITTGQYSVFDINNGFIALHRKIYKDVNFKNISDDYFFETSMVAEMRNIGCKILDLEIETEYNNEKSNLIIKRVLFKFILKHSLIFFKRIYFEYIKNKNYLVLLIIFGILSSLVLSIYSSKILIVFIILIFIFFIKDKNFKNIER